MNPRVADMLARYRAGEKLAAIGALYGVSRQRVEQVARRYGLEHRARGGRAKPKAPPKVGPFGRLPFETRNRAILDQWERGRTTAEIADGMLLTHTTVRGVVRDHGRRRQEQATSHGRQLLNVGEPTVIRNSTSNLQRTEAPQWP